MTQAPPHTSSGELFLPPGNLPAWEELRDQVMAALEEDPVNESYLLRHLDQHQGLEDLKPAQRVLAALMGYIPPPLEAERQLSEALAMRQRWSAQGERSVPLRLALLEAVLRENGRRPEPLQVELRLAGAISGSGLLDPCTGATSRAALLGAIQTELKRARRTGQEAALLCLYLDDLQERLADGGRAAGERLMSAVILLVNNEIRDVDWSARSVAQDLVIFLSGTGRAGATLVARRIVDKLASVGPKLWAGTPVTASMGVATFPSEARFGQDLLDAARRAMFLARAAGGHRVVHLQEASQWKLLRVEPDRLQVVVRVLTGPEATLPQESDAGAGILFTCNEPYQVGTMLDLDCIEVGGSGRARLSGPVVLLERRLGGAYDVGVACSLQQETAALLGDQPAAVMR